MQINSLDGLDCATSAEPGATGGPLPIEFDAWIPGSPEKLPMPATGTASAAAK